MITSATNSGDLYSGLAALNWATHDEPGSDYPFYRQLLLSNISGGYRALEVGCGCGRLLRRYLHEGIPVDGCDASAAMLSACYTRAAAEDLPIRLFHQHMEFLSLPDRYSMLYIPCATLMCVASPEAAARSIARCAAHLERNGLLALNIHVPGANALRGPTSWMFNNESWVSEQCLLRADRRIVATDLAHSVELEQHRYQLVHCGNLVAEEHHFGNSRWHTPTEVLAWITAAGMSDIVTYGDFRPEPFDPAHHRMFVVTARRTA